MDDRSDMEKGDEVILPGFRFHPTDEELVSFYLKRKVQQKPLSIELIRQLDIYKYDPWDLPKLATTGEKEWYFYCPRDRKYRNSTRPNRVTGAGFWKATGTDRPIYSSEGSKCIGLKKSLVFYKGRAAKGVKTDWMMHEFRLPSLTDSSLFKRPLDKTIPANDSWAICRIFKKTNSVAQRALSHSWVSPQPDPTANEPDLFSLPPPPSHNIHFGSDIISSIAESMPLACSSYNLQQQQQQQQQQNAFNFPPLDFISSFKPTDHLNISWSKPACSSAQTPKSFTFSPVVDTLIPPKCAMDVTSMLLNNLSPALLLGDVGKTSTNIDFSGQQQQQQCNEFAVDLPLESNANFRKSTEVDFPFGLPPTFTDEWKPSLACVSTPYQCGISTSTYSTDKY